mgnify:FL=1
MLVLLCLKWSITLTEYSVESSVRAMSTKISWLMGLPKNITLRSWFTSRLQAMCWQLLNGKNRSKNGGARRRINWPLKWILNGRIWVWSGSRASSGIYSGWNRGKQNDRLWLEMMCYQSEVKAVIPNGCEESMHYKISPDGRNDRWGRAYVFDRYLSLFTS